MLRTRGGLSKSGKSKNGQGHGANRRPIVALFRKKDSAQESQASPADGGGKGTGTAGGDGFEPQPEKARKWFEHARSMADRYSYDTAIFYYASGINLDPEMMSAHEAIYECAIQYTNRSGKPAASKDIKKIEADTAVSKMAAAEYAWMMDIRNAALGLKAVELAVKAEMYEVGNWMATHLYPLMRTYKKINKALYLRGKEAFAAVSAWDEAIKCGEAAMALDPRDADLEAEIKNLSAQRAMDQGGYEEAASKDGGFREMIKDADRQRELMEDDSISASASVEERNLERAKAAYEADPTVSDSINKYAAALRRTETPENLEIARDVLMKGYEATREYRFRMAAGDIQIRALRRKERALRDRVGDGDASANAELESIRRERLELESAEYNERVKKYPTDRVMKYDLGKVEFELGNVQNAMACFQASKDEPRYKVRAAHMLGQCFALEGWHLDAIAEYREAIAAIDATEKDREIEVRYDLMISLLENAKVERSLDDARNAREICSSIARKDITYRDIREKRNEIEQVIKDLT